MCTIIISAFGSILFVYSGGISMQIVIARTTILYLVVIVVIRLMGKRQIGELQPFELAITIMISALAAIPMEDIGIPLIFSLIPILLLLAFQEIISFAMMRFPFMRVIICGRPNVIINRGEIQEEELEKLRINLTDLLEQLRIKGYHSLDDIEYAIMETTGDISVIPKATKRPLIPSDLELTPRYEGLPLSIIIDGHLQPENLEQTAHDMAWLKDELKKKNIYDIKECFFAGLNSQGKFICQKRKGK